MIIRVLSLLVVCCLINSLWAQETYFVSSSATDEGNGSYKFPFLCIEKALEEARTSSAKEIVIYLRGGTYRLDRPLVLTPEDGAEDKHLYIRSYPSETAIISGGKVLDLEWEPHKKGIMKARVATGLSVDMLLVDGSLRPMARYPNYDSTAVRLNGTSADAIAPERVMTWGNPKGGYLHAMHASDWGSVHYRITGKDTNGNLTLEGGWQNNRKSAPHSQNRMVENIFEELDTPGEWYFDRESRFLYYYPLLGEQVDLLLFETSQLKGLLELRGSCSSPVRNIVLEDLVFTQTARTFMEDYEPLLRSDWCIYRGGAILLEGTEHCIIRNCDFHHLGGNAVFFSNYNRNSGISGSLIERIGASAVCFVGNPDAVRSPCFSYGDTVPIDQLDVTPGPANDDFPSNCFVSDNLIHHIGLYEKQVAGVELSMCSHITVSHNSIYQVPRSGINVSEGTWGGHLIVYNDVFDTVMETGDHGAFNSWGRDRYWSCSRETIAMLQQKYPGLVFADAVACTTIANNRFRCDRGWDIDLDDGSSNYHIFNNLCLNGGIKLREGFYRIVENNIMVNNTFHPHVWFAASGDVFTRNLVMSAYRPIGVSHWGTEIDYNIFTDSTAYRAALKNKTDQHSIVHAVQFKNPLMGDFSLLNSQGVASACGFKNFTMDRFGVFSSRLRQLARIPLMPIPVVQSQNRKTEVWEGVGLLLKSLDTLEERSATGMDSERGVYVISVQVLKSPFRDLLRPNDVILKLGDTEIHTLSDWKKTIEDVDWKQPQKLIIFREQKLVEKVIYGGMIDMLEK